MILKNNLYKIKSGNRDEQSFRIELIRDCIIYKAHFPGNPITPGVCIIQIATELLSELCDNRTLELLNVSNAKYLAVIAPNQTEELSYRFKKIEISEDQLRMKASVDVCNEDTIFTKLSLVYSIQ